MYVVIGAGGFLGSYLVQAILRQTKEQVLAVARHRDNISENRRIEFFACDIAEREQVLALNERLTEEREPCKVICLAAYHHPDLVAQNPKIAWNINIIALACLLNTLENVKCFYYPSTDTVYGEGGRTHHFSERDKLNPVNLYGKQKALAEQLVITYGYHIVRYPFLIGPSLLKTKKHFYDEIVANISRGIPMEMYRDSLRSSLDFYTAANLLIAMVERYDCRAPQIVNISGDQDLTKYDVGLMIADQLQISREMIIPVSVKESSEIFTVPRAAGTLLDNFLIKSLLELSEIRLTLRCEQ